MEGFIPMVYKAVKRNKTRRQYQFLSSGAAQSYNNVSDFYVNAQGRHHGLENHIDTSWFHSSSERNGHRRTKSVEDFSGEFIFSADDNKVKAAATPPPPSSKQLVRFRSHRMFSCITGA